MEMVSHGCKWYFFIDVNGLKGLEMDGNASKMAVNGCKLLETAKSALKWL